MASETKVTTLAPICTKRKLDDATRKSERVKPKHPKKTEAATCSKCENVAVHQCFVCDVYQCEEHIITHHKDDKLCHDCYQDVKEYDSIDNQHEASGDDTKTTKKAKTKAVKEKKKKPKSKQPKKVKVIVPTCSKCNNVDDLMRCCLCEDLLCPDHAFSDGTDGEYCEPCYDDAGECAVKGCTVAGGTVEPCCNTECTSAAGSLFCKSHRRKINTWRGDDYICHQCPKPPKCYECGERGGGNCLSCR